MEFVITYYHLLSCISRAEFLKEICSLMENVFIRLESVVAKKTISSTIYKQFALGSFKLALKPVYKINKTDLLKY